MIKTNDENQITTKSDQKAIKPKARIWELDFLRGLFIWFVVAIHALFDLTYFYGVKISFVRWPVFEFIQNNGGVLFILISGICVTLGRRFIKRGLIVLGGGVIISLVTIVMYKLGFCDKSVIIYWGILHLLGFSMLMYGLLKRLPTWVLGILGSVLTIAGYLISYFDVRSKCPALVVFGIMTPGFSTGDYFPIFPMFGWFVIGVFIGRLLYREKKSLMPKVNERFFLIRFFTFSGRQSLWIYLAHQPIVYGVLALLNYWKVI